MPSSATATLDRRRGLTEAAREQRMAALERAQIVRLGHVALAREIAGGETTLRGALLDPRAETLRIHRMLCFQRGWGPRRATRLLSRLQIHEMRTVGLLTERQVDLIHLYAGRW